MISVIIASANSALLEKVKVNIAETIGVSFEILSFDNADGSRGICEIYNEGIAKASYQTLCFMHEDIAMLTTGWGQLVEGYFQQNARLGIIGIAGSTFKSVIPIGWPSEGSPETERCNLVQCFKYSRQEPVHKYKNPANESLSLVVVVDGVWMCVRKEVAEKFQFDNDTFKGFHGYDIDFCLSVGKVYQIGAIYNVLLQHLSEGNWNRIWIKESLLLQRKWESELPRSTVPVSAKRIRKIERHNFRFWLQQIHALGFESGLAFKVLYRARILQVVGLKYFLKLHYSIWREYYGNSKQR